MFFFTVQCPIEKTGYFEVLGKCYFTDTIKRNFDHSQAHCEEIFPFGGRLYEPRDLATNAEVGKAHQKYHGNRSDAWIGITDRISQGTYQYASDNGHLTISRWFSGEPNNDGARCVVYGYGSTGVWFDDYCSAQEFYFCERTY